MKISIFVFFLLSFIISKNLGKCKRELTESNGINSYIEPARETLSFCGSSVSSCCPAYEQIKMFEKYQTTLKPHYKNVIKLVGDELVMLQSMLANAKDKIPAKVAAIGDKAKKLQAEDKLNKINSIDINAVLDVAVRHHKKAGEYVASMKSAYFCTVCDFKNHALIDIPAKKFKIDAESCDALVRHTLLFSNAINVGLLPFIENIAGIEALAKNQEKSMKIPGLKAVVDSINDCAEEYKQFDHNLTSCKNYCSYVKLNSEMPVYEGYPETFANAIYLLKSMGFAAAPTPAAPEKAAEGEKKEETAPKDKARILFEGRGRVHKKAKRTRILEEKNGVPFVDSLKYTERLKKHSIDIWDPSAYDSTFDDAKMINMFEIQKILNNDNADDIDSMIREQFVKGYAVPIEDIEALPIFATAVKERVNIAEFTSVMDPNGINIHKIVTNMDWGLEFHDIVLSLNGVDGGAKETLEGAVLEMVNGIGDDDVKCFHEDPGIEFKRYVFLSPEYIDMKKTEIEAIIKKMKEEKEAELLNMLTANKDEKDPNKVAQQLNNMENQDFLEGEQIESVPLGIDTPIENNDETIQVDAEGGTEQTQPTPDQNNADQVNG